MQQWVCHVFPLNVSAMCIYHSTQFLCYQSTKRMNTKVDTVVSCDILICGFFIPFLTHRSILHVADFTEQKYNSEFVIFFPRSCLVIVIVTQRSCLSLHQKKKKKTQVSLWLNAHSQLGNFFVKQLINITLSGVGKVFIFAAHPIVELQPIQNAIYHSYTEMLKIVIWEEEKGSPQGIRKTPLLLVIKKS